METTTVLSKQAYLLTKQDGSTVLLFDSKRAHGLAGHFGWTVKTLTAQEAAQHIRATFKQATA